MPEFTLAEIAQKIGGKVHGNAELIITGAAEIHKANLDQITFLANPKYNDHLINSQAGAVIVDGKCNVTPSQPHIIAIDAYFGFLQTFLLFNDNSRMLAPGIHETAVIHPSALIGKNVTIGANAYIGENVSVGENSQIFPNCVILNNSSIGKDCLFYPLVSVREDCIIGDRVILHNGAVIGSDGFGFAPYQDKFHKIPQVGKVIIKDDVEIGANATIDRATMGETIIKTGVKIDNMVHLAHNVTVGEHTVIAAQTGISGSTQIGNHVMIGGQVGTVGHIKIGNGAKIAAKTGVPKNVPENEVLFGAVGRPAMKAKRIEAALNGLPELSKRVKKMEKMLAEMENESHKP